MKKTLSLILKGLIIIICIVVLLVVAVLLINHYGGGKQAIKLKQETHSRVADLEQYVYDTLGGSIYFGEPEIDDELKTATIIIIEDENDYHIDEFDMARCLINQYLEDNPDCFLNNGYRIRLSYNEWYTPPGHRSSAYTVGYAYNYCEFNGVSSNGIGKGTIDFDNIVVVRGTSFYGYHFYYRCPSIKVMDMRSLSVNYEDVLDIVRNAPDIEYIYIGNDVGDIESLIEDIHEVDPQLIILWSTE